MIFLQNNHTENFEEEEEEKGIDDSLLGELGDGVLDEDELLEAELDPLLKAHVVIDPLALGLDDEDGPVKEGVKVFEDDEEDEDVDDYDSFDDRDEM